ncbi:hypothetical protein ABT026_11245 [Streptomyces sp. NPDC002734]|uniref:hypothetical protein n=1 Tax=Streptomyces sp. NPDC002734 TaxID=3154426 RepID=UPI003325CF5B
MTNSEPTPIPAAPPATIWIPDAEETSTRPFPGCVLPAWALDKIRTELVGRPEHDPARLLKIAIRDLAHGVDARIPAVDLRAPGPVRSRPSSRPRLLLAELHPDALPVAALQPDCDGTDDLPGATENGWPGFFHRAHRYLPDDGLLLLATRQRRDAGRLTDPLGLLTAHARTAGFRYLQHIAVAYARPRGNTLIPTPPHDAPPGLAHCDLLVFSVIRHP